MASPATQPPPRVTVSPSVLQHRSSTLSALNGSSSRRKEKEKEKEREEPVEETPVEPFLLPHERDLLVLSTVVKVLLYPT